jgi:hypothetical protein
MRQTDSYGTIRYCRCVPGVTKDAGTARCVIASVVVSSQSTGSAVSEGQVVFSVLFVHVLN